MADKMNILKSSRRATTLTVLGAIAIGLLFSGSRAGATGFSPNVREGSDIVMKDRRWPEWDQGTYHCFWYMSFVPKHPRLGNFYGGVATKGPEQSPGMFMSYWGEVTTIHQGEYFYRHGYGAEGSSGGAHGRAVFLRPGAWYRFVMRIFPPAEGSDQKTCVGWWLKDIEKNQWYTHSVVSLPARATGFQGNSGFVEALAPESVHRAFERRLGYCRKDGKWYKSNEVSSRNPSQFKLIENDTVLRFDRPVKNDAGTVKSAVPFTTKQPDEPALDPPAIERAEAYAWGNQVTVKWNIPGSASPQLGYKLEVFAARDAKGTPLKVVEETSPGVLARRLDVGRPAKSVRLTVTDIFDQQKAITIPIADTSLRSPPEPPVLAPGLNYAYYEAPKNTDWQRLPDFATLTPVRQGRVVTLDDTVRQDRDKNYALRYTGYVRTPADGLYVISAGTCDGSRLSIDGKVIADNDGIHSASVKQYPIALKKGLHYFELLYFKGPGRRHHANIPNRISVSWEGPGFELRKLADSDFMCKDAGLPSLTLGLNSAVTDGLVKDNLVEMGAKTDPRGHRIDKVQLYSGRMLLATAEGADLGRTGDIAFKVLFPAGKNRIWARLWYDDHCSVDSQNELNFEVQEYTEGPWKFIVLGHKFPIGVRYKDGTASFTGEGFYVGYQKVSGDFTLTARIADIALTTKENGIHGSNWLGLFTSDVKKPRKGQGLESTFNQWGFSIYRTAGQGMRGTADFPDLGGGRMCIPSFPEDHRWLKIVRRGKRFEAFTSADGKTWQKAMERVTQRFADEQYVGVCFRAIPGKGRGLFQGAFDNITLGKGNAPEVREKPRKNDLGLKNRVTALVQPRKDPKTLYARSPSKGLLKSTDRGETWKAVNSGLNTLDAMAVRSVAVHPGSYGRQTVGNADVRGLATVATIVLRAGGSVVDGTLKSGLWRSTDGGTSWKLVTREIDFDGRGPTALFGEVVAFCPQDPNLVAAGGETKGLFLSRDAGSTWKLAGLEGERVTSLGFIPKTGKSVTLVVGTFADSEFKTLGLGTPVSPVKGPGRIYWTEFRDGKHRFGTSCELENFGVTNIGFGAHENFATFATTRGIYYTWQHGNMFSQRRYEMPSDILFTALGYRQFMKETRPNEWRLKSTTYAAPFSGKQNSPVYCVPERTTGKWSLLADKAKVDAPGAAVALNAGISCILPDKEEAKTLYLCNRHGIYKSTDGGRSYKVVYTPSP